MSQATWLGVLVLVALANQAIAACPGGDLVPIVAHRTYIPGTETPIYRFSMDGKPADTTLNEETKRDGEFSYFQAYSANYLPLNDLAPRLQCGGFNRKLLVCEYNTTVDGREVLYDVMTDLNNCNKFPGTTLKFAFFVSDIPRDFEDTQRIFLGNCMGEHGLQHSALSLRHDKICPCSTYTDHIVFHAHIGRIFCPSRIRDDDYHPYAMPSRVLKAREYVDEVLAVTAWGCCAPGFQPQRGNVCEPYICDEDSGDWRTEDGLLHTCEIVRCGLAPEADHGKWTALAGSYEYTAQRSLECDAGYVSETDDVITCSSEGRWEYATPQTANRCVRLSCGGPPAAQNGEYLAKPDARTGELQQQYGDKASLRCDPGFDTLSAVSIECLDSGRWSAPVELCMPVGCPFPGGPVNGAIVGLQHPVGSVLRYSCDSGFRLVGASSISCLDNGSWTAAAPACKPL